VLTRLTAEVCERFYSIEELRCLSRVAHGRERLVLRIFIDAGLRAQELFALRANDVQPLRLRVDEALKETERGKKRLGTRMKNRGSRSYVAISADLEREIRGWIEYAGVGPDDFLFPILKPLGISAGIADMTYQALRRTCATHFQRHGTPRDTQAQMRHSSMRKIPEAVREAVERMDAELWQRVDQDRRIQ
jgi:integrase